MGLTATQLKIGLDTLAGRDQSIARALEQAGYPPPRSRPAGYETLLRTIVGQQVSVKAAAAVWDRLENRFGTGLQADHLIDATDDDLRACGLSRQKAGYTRSLAGAVLSGSINLDAMPDDDEAAIAQLVQIKGIGRWSAEIYLLFAEGRPDIWPAGDLAVQIQLGRLHGLPDKPTEKETRAIAEGWRPHRGAAAIFAWHLYNSSVF